MSDDSAPALSVFALLATLRAAFETRHAIAERRAGRDPSEQEAAASARAHLREALPELREHIARLRVGLVVERADESETTGLVRAFEDRLVLARLARALHLVHQRLLSLYPDVDEALVEAARLRQQEAEGLAGASGDGFERVLLAWLNRAAALCEGLEEVAVRTN